MIIGSLPVTVEQKTGRGRQLFFKLPPGNLKFNKEICPDIHIKGPGGYVLLPPSIHPSGKQYTWVNSPWEKPFADLPEAWLQMAVKKDEPSKKGEKQPSQPFEIKNEIIPEGCRNDKLFKLASSLRAKGLQENEIMVTVSKVNSNRCMPPLPDSDIKTIVSSAGRYKPGELKTDSSKTLDMIPAFLSLDPKDCEAVEYLWQPYFPKRAVSIIQGISGAGKSVFMNALSCTISKGVFGDPFLGTIPAAKVLYFNSEDDYKSVFLPRLLAASFSRENFKAFDWFKSPIKFGSPVFEEILKRENPDLAVFDVLKDFMPEGKVTDKSGDVREVVNGLKLLAEKYNCSIVLVAHIGKNGKMEGVYRSMGSSDWGSAARSVVEITEDTAAEVCNVHHLKLNGGIKGLGIGYRRINSTLGTDSNGKEITAPKVEWCSPSKTREEVDAQFHGMVKDENAEDKTPMQEARQYLIDQLSDGPKPAKELLASVKYLGFGIATLKKAKAAFDVKSFKEGDVWMWRFPADMDFEDQINVKGTA
jgi:hypothetical protein